MHFSDLIRGNRNTAAETGAIIGPAPLITIVACSQCQTVVGQASQVGLESGNQNQTRRSPKASAAASEVAAAPLWLIKMFCIYLLYIDISGGLALDNESVITGCPLLT